MFMISKVIEGSFHSNKVCLDDLRIEYSLAPSYLLLVFAESYDATKNLILEV